MLFGDGPERNKLANTGVGKNNIDLPLLLGNRLVKTIKVGQFGNVSLSDWVLENQVGGSIPYAWHSPHRQALARR